MGKHIVEKFPDPKRIVVKRKSILHNQKSNKNNPTRESCYNKDSKANEKLEEKENKDNLEIEDLRIRLKTSSLSGKQYLSLVKYDCDLFAYDEFKARYEQFTKYDLVYVILDEIALEGLDGITIEGLWKRIQNTLRIDKCPVNLQEVAWKLICLHKKIKIFKLNEQRDNLDMNVFSNLISKNVDIYKVVTAPKGSNQWGSCSTLSSRVDITEDVKVMTLEEAYKKYLNTLVLVADEDLRKNAIFDEAMDANFEFTQTEYCLLERIGRARYLGEVTLGPSSLTNAFKMDPKSMFHYCKKFSKEHLCVKQYCFIANEELSQGGSLIHLRRFYQRKMSRIMTTITSIVNCLKDSPNYRAPSSDIRVLIPDVIKSSSVLKNPVFQTYVDTNVFVPYRELYTNATRAQYMTKNYTKERTIQMFQLKDPTVNIEACFSDPTTGNSSDEDDDGESGTFTNKRRCMKKDMTRDIYLYIASCGSEGTKVQTLLQTFDVDFSMLRSILKKLTTRKSLYIKKEDIGKQTVNKYVASLTHDLSESETLDTTNCIKRVCQIAPDLPNKRIRLDGFEAEMEHEILNLETHYLFPTSFPIVNVSCPFFITQIIESRNFEQIDSLWKQLVIKFVPFQINVRFAQCLEALKPQLSDALYSEVISAAKAITQKPYSGEEFCSMRFKPDYLSKAFLLGALLHTFNIDEKRIMELLDPTNKSQSAKKRLLENKIEEKQDASKRRRKLPNLESSKNSLGSNPVEIETDVDTETGFCTKILSSNSLCPCKTGDISQYVQEGPHLTTDRVLSRIKFILQSIQKERIFEGQNIMLRLIQKHEAETGYDKKMDKKSLYRIYNRLADEGYIKIFNITLSKEPLIPRVYTFVCHPEIEYTNKILQDKISHLKQKAICFAKKSVPIAAPKKPKSVVPQSPFVQDDVLTSINEIKDLNIQNITDERKKLIKTRRQARKFVRMACLHEFLFYLIYELDQDTRPLTKVQVTELFSSHKIKLTEEELNKLPEIYCNEISWKTFIRPLPSHQGWENGWALLIDVILRMPASIVMQCCYTSYITPELQDVAQHPVKRFYSFKDLTLTVSVILRQDRNLFFNLYSRLINLCYCGLVQFGPTTFHEKEKSFFYLNKKASLLDTVSSAPGYHLVEDKEYPKLSFEFNCLDDVTNYWRTMNNICIHTRLNSRRLVEGQTITLIHNTAKESLMKCRATRTAAEAKLFDTGELPGDRRGAAGIDSSLWSHMSRNWTSFGLKNDCSLIESADIFKSGKVVDNTATFDKLKLMASNEHHYLKKPHQQAIVSSTYQRPVRTTRKVPILKRVVAVRKRIERKPAGLDNKDKAILRRLNGQRYKPKWSDEEDKLLILSKVAAIYLSPGSNHQIINYSVMRDVLFVLNSKCRDKTSRTICNRIRLLFKSRPFLSNIENIIDRLSKMVPVARYFLPLRKLLMHGKSSSRSDEIYKISEAERHVAFVFLMQVFISHRAEVEKILQGQSSKTDYFNAENLDYFKERIEPLDSKLSLYKEPTSTDDVKKFTLTSVIQSALIHKTDKPEWQMQMYKIYQQFSDTLLRITLKEMKKLRMIQAKAISRKTSFSPYRLSMHYVYSQTCTFGYNVIEEAYSNILMLRDRPEEFIPISDSKDVIKYGQLFSVNEIISFMLDRTSFIFNFPVHHLILNPSVEDHSDLIDELAKRYQAKFKTHQRDTESQAEQPINIKIEDENKEIEEESPKTSPEEDDAIFLDEDEPLDLSLTAKDTIMMDNLKHWISDCIKEERVRSPSPELLNMSKSERGEMQDEQTGSTEASTDRELTLEEIKEEMLKPYDPTAKRQVPYILDLTKLLSTNFEESEESASDLLRKHFVQEYPKLEKIRFEGLDSHLMTFVREKCDTKKLWSKIERAAYVGVPSSKEVVLDDLIRVGRTPEYVTLAEEIIDYIENKGPYGASAWELKETFQDLENDCCLILNTLVEHHIILKTGVTTLKFVHHKFRNVWLTDTFVMPADQPDVSKECDMDWIKIQPFPWATVEGVLNKNLFKMWLSLVFSYCIENPKCFLTSVCDKFMYLKPVDVFYLVQILEAVGAIELRRVRSDNANLFSQWQYEEERVASMLDRFEEIYINVNNMSFTLLGSFLHDS